MLKKTNIDLKLQSATNLADIALIIAGAVIIIIGAAIYLL
jgi:hypothetical protein